MCRVYRTDRVLARVGLTNQARTKQAYIGSVCVCVRVGSEVSVHAAVCTWGSARLLAAEIATDARRRLAIAASDASAGDADPCLWARPLRVGAGELNHVHKTVRLLMSMACKGTDVPV